MDKWSDSQEDFKKLKKVLIKWVKSLKNKFKNLFLLFRKDLKSRNKNLMKLNYSKTIKNYKKN